MKPRLSLVLAAGLLVAADRPDPRVVKQEWKKLEGTWTLTQMEVGGRSLLEKGKPLPKVRIKDGRIAAADAPKGAPTDAPAIHLDPTRRPKAITIPNFKDSPNPQKGLTVIGIYELKGDVLRVCVQAVETARLKEREKERPRAFDSKQGLLLVFKRKGK